MCNVMIKGKIIALGLKNHNHTQSCTPTLMWGPYYFANTNHTTINVVMLQFDNGMSDIHCTKGIDY